jgi:hypothetical protein
MKKELQKLTGKSVKKGKLEKLVMSVVLALAGYFGYYPEAITETLKYWGF